MTDRSSRVGAQPEGERRAIRSGASYEAKVGYARAQLCDGWIFVSGTTGTDHRDQSIPPDVVDQCRLALSHIEAALAEAGASFRDVVRVRYILPDRDAFEPCWPLLRAAFGPAEPAATMIVAGLIDPAMKIEIEVTARVPQPG